MKSINQTNILILNYNGVDLLKECLPSIVVAANKSKRHVKITVIDNASQDDSVIFLKKYYPQVIVEALKQNKILCSYNEVLQKVTEDVIILLNNDLKVDPNFVDPLIDPFEKDERIFSVGCKCLDYDGKGYQGEKSIADVRCGMFWTDSRFPGYQCHVDESSLTFQVALGAFDRKKFLALGGYDPIFLPGMWEDSDISFNAYRRGWHCYYEPRSIIFHKGQITFHRVHGNNEREIIAYRNAFLFFWKNFSGSHFMILHALFLPARIAFALLKGNFNFLRGFGRALQYRSKMQRFNLSSAPYSVRSNTEILRIIKQAHLRQSI